MYFVVDELKRTLKEEKKAFEEMDGFEHLKNLRCAEALSEIFSKAAESSHDAIEELSNIFKQGLRKREVMEGALEEIENLKEPIQSREHGTQLEWYGYQENKPFEAAKLLFRETLIQKLTKSVKELE